jgi:high-affinity Fe2+/Pb2+ permease
MEKYDKRINHVEEMLSSYLDDAKSISVKKQTETVYLAKDIYGKEAEQIETDVITIRIVMGTRRTDLESNKQSKLTKSMIDNSRRRKDWKDILDDMKAGK